MKPGDLVIVPYDSWEDEFVVVGVRPEPLRRVDVGEVGMLVKTSQLDPAYWHTHFTEQGALWVPEEHLEVVNGSRL